MTMHRLGAALLLASGIAGCAVVPEPITTGELALYADDKRQRVIAEQAPVSGRIDLYGAMARALKYNLDKQVKIMEVALSDRQLRVAHFSKLPQVVANSGYAARDNYAGGSSVRILAPRQVGSESLSASSSSERKVRSADLTFSWHILDFGLSWIRAKQAADRALIADENLRRIINRTVEDVRVAYWRAVTATRLAHRLRRLDARVDRALRDAKNLANRGDTSPLTALTNERELVEIQREIRTLRGNLASARAELAALMNVKPGAKFDVKIPDYLPEPQRVRQSPYELVSIALLNRSELREAAYNERINRKEAEAAIIEMLPGVSFSAAPNWNSNQYLFNSHWISWGAQASWNLIKVFSYPARRAEVLAKDDLLDRRALALTMAIITQVHVSRARLFHARRKFRSAKRFNDVQRRIVRQIRIALKAGKASEQSAIREEMNGLVASAKLDLAYVELQSAFAALHASTGRTPYADVDHDHMSVEQLRAALRQGWRHLGDRSI